jgi:hypothetical protein
MAKNQQNQKIKKNEEVHAKNAPEVKGEAKHQTRAQQFSDDRHAQLR